jgi:hypothetical protein
MPANVNERVEIVGLGRADAAQVEALFRAAEQRVASGFLARRKPGAYAELLGRDDTVAVGARAGQTLVGYSLCYRIRENPYPRVTFLHALDPAGSVIYHGGGTVIAPRYEGRLLSRRLFLARRAELDRRGTRHFLGLIAVGNWLSLGNAVHAGGVLVGMAPDETSMNYVVYSGELLRDRAATSECLLDWRDADGHERMFAAGGVVTGIDGGERPAEGATESASETAERKTRRFVFSYARPIGEVSA